MPVEKVFQCSDIHAQSYPDDHAEKTKCPEVKHPLCQAFHVGGQVTRWKQQTLFSQALLHVSGTTMKVADRTN